MRDSEAIQAHDPPRGLGPPTPAGLQDERAEGGPSRGHHGCSVLEGAFAGLHFMEDIDFVQKHQPPTGWPRRGGRCGAATRHPRPQRGRISRRQRGGDPATVGGEGSGGELRSRSVPPGSGRRGEEEEETRLFPTRGDRGELGDCGAHHVVDGVVAKDAVAPAAARKGVVDPERSKNFVTHVGRRNRDPTAACGGDAAKATEKRREET